MIFSKIQTLLAESSLLAKPVTKIEIPLHQKLRFKEREEDLGVIIGKGEVHSVFNAELDVWDLTLRYEQDVHNPRSSIFIRGHEEGHVCLMTGNLNILFDRARKLGLGRFFNMDREEIQLADQAAVSAIEMRPPKFDILPRSQNEELIADLAGLIALISISCSVEIIRRLLRVITKQSFVRETPDAIEKID